MKILYIFPHPDDESFGPAPGMYSQIREGHEVYLLTLTRGGATKQRFKYDYTVEQMGEVRYQEMLEVAKVLQLTGMEVLDLPDSGLKEMNPIEIENVIERHIETIKPDIVVTYAVHGVSGFHDHLVSHAVVKRVFCKMREGGSRFPRRFAMLTLNEADKPESPFNLSHSKDEEIDCVLETDAEAAEKGRQSLMCYKTYQEVINKTSILENVTGDIHYEFFQEDFKPPLKDMTENLPD